MKRFYSNTLPLIIGTEVIHATKVLRCKEGDSIEVIDGKGKLYTAVIAHIYKHEIHLNNLVILKDEIPHQQVSIAIAPTKNLDRIEWMVEKTCEIGIKAIYPIITHRSEKTAIKLERLQNIAIAAIKQSRQLWIPEIAPLQRLSSFIENNIDCNNLNLIAHCENSNKQNLQTILPTTQNIFILIGPEGDFTSEEIELCSSKKFIPISLGNRILRTETAAVYATTILNFINEKN